MNYLSPHNRQPGQMPEIVTPFDLESYGYDRLDSEVAFDRWMIDRVDRLANPEGLKFRDIEDPTFEFPVLKSRPTMTAGIFMLRTKFAKAVVLVNYACGTTPAWLSDPIKELVDNGVPVFLVSDNPGDPAGILNVRRYGAGEGAADAGAKPIEKVNVREVDLVKQAVRDYYEEGYRGKGLAEVVYKMFAYQEGEEKPLAEWDDPAALEKYRKEVVEPYLKRIGAHTPEDEFDKSD